MHYDHNEQTLASALEKIRIDSQADIPWIVRLLENPQSPLALPGKISLYDHDCLHILLDKTTTVEDEAFVIGFTMGNDRDTKLWMVRLFKFISSHWYPQQYCFLESHWQDYDEGYRIGKTFTVQFNKIDFQCYQNWKIGDLKRKFGLVNNSIW
jgi:hypothetical protein